MEGVPAAVVVIWPVTAAPLGMTSGLAAMASMVFLPCSAAPADIIAAVSAPPGPAAAAGIAAPTVPTESPMSAVICVGAIGGISRGCQKREGGRVG